MPFISTVETFSHLLPQAGQMADAGLRIQPNSAMPPRKAARFPRTARLLRHAEFERVYKQGRRHFSATMTVFYWPRPETNGGMEPMRAKVSAPLGLRVGFTVGRALGGAVQRNRMKRRLREAVRLSLPWVAVPADVVINPKKSLLTADFSVVLNEVSRAFAVIEKKLSQEMSPTVANKISGSRQPNAESES